jgi:apolipoprotein N-acyltransferase
MSSSARARWSWRAAALAAGALQTFAFAPFGWWPLAILCPLFLMGLWREAGPRAAAALGFWFGAGLFGAGTWWLYIPIHTIEAAPLWLTFFLLIALASLMAAYYALLGAVSAWLLPREGYWRLLAGLPALWLLFEWWRGWFISGFPWLSLGYSLVDSPLKGYAPLLGVYGLSALALWQGAALLALWRGSGRARAGIVACSALVWIGGSLLTRVDWTVPRSEPVPVAILQGAIPQDEKWQVDNLEPTKLRYRAMNDQATGARLLIWPESAIPELANDYARYLADIQASSRGRGADVIMGVIRLADNGQDYYNSILALTGGVAFYDKRHLVPFSEYQPVPPFLRRWLQFMNLPYADFTAGSELQTPMQAAGLSFAPSVCYEDGFGSAQLALARRADALVNVTNDAWFGRSPARYQHLQIARMRALETGRYLLRAANDGISAIIGPHGEVLATAPEFVPAVLRGTVVPMAGLSPYARAGNWPVLALAWLFAAGAGWRRRAWWGLPLPGKP